MKMLSLFCDASEQRQPRSCVSTRIPTGKVMRRKSPTGKSGKQNNPGATLLMAAAICLVSTAQPGSAQTTMTPSEPLQTVIPVKLDTTTGGITVGSTLYKGATPGFHVLVISRAQIPAHLDAPQVLLDQTYNDPVSVNSALQSVKQSYLNPTPMVIINAVGDYGIPLNSVAQTLTGFGAYPDLAGIPFPFPLVFIGTGGANPMTALQRGGSTRELAGYLAPDTNGNYAFLQTDFVHYDIGVDGTITIGKTQYKAADAGQKVSCDGTASDSLHLLVVDRESPDLVLINNVYCTGQHPENLAVMGNDLTNLTDESKLIFIATNGHPIPSDWNFNTGGDLRGLTLARQIARLGGYYETIMYLSPTDTYSLVTAPPPPSYVPHASARAKEYSSVYVDGPKAIQPTGELHGVLARGRGNFYSPLNADPSGIANLGLYDILAQTSVAFPHPAGVDEQKAFDEINYSLCQQDGCNIRNSYNNLSINLTATYQGPLQSMVKDDSGNDCSDKANANLPFCAVRAQLLTELIDVANIKEFYNNVNNLWLANGTTSILSLLSAYDTVKATIPVMPTEQSPSLVGPLVNFFLSVAGNIPVVGPAFGLADTAFNLGLDLTTDKQGNKTTDLTSTIAHVEDQAIDHFKSQATTTGTTVSLIFQDWGKINALASNLKADATKPGAPWYWKGDTTGQMLNNMEAPIKLAAYQNIMPAAYAIGKYIPGTGYRNCNGRGPWPIWGQTPLYSQPWAYFVLDTNFPACPAGSTPTVQPFNSDLGYTPYTFPNDPGNPFAKSTNTSTMMADGAWLGISLQTAQSNGGSTGAYFQPDSSLLSTLFKPVVEGGLGVYRPDFFEGWPFPHVTCDYSSGVTPPGAPGASNGGCDWTSGITPVTLPAPNENISIGATQVARNGTQATVLLRIHNNGSVAANAISFTSISVRTLAGSGVVTVLGQSLPTTLRSLPAGDSMDLKLTLDIPDSVTKLQITQQGTADLGQLEPIRFTGGEVLYPTK